MRGGVRLRGAFRPAAGDVGEAPVVLHLLAASVSTTGGVPTGFGSIGLGPTLDALAAEGCATLVLDHRGVGASEGRRDASRLIENGRAMWREAVRRAGGEERVVLRTSSLGSLVVADLLAGGARPAGVILIAPIRASTIVANAARSRTGAFVAGLAAARYRSPAAPDLEVALAAAAPGVPVVLVLGDDDHDLPAAERRLVVEAAAVHGHRVVLLEASHEATVLRAWGFLVEHDADGGFSGRREDGLRPWEGAFLDRVETRLGGSHERGP